MMETTSHRPWESHPPPSLPQTNQTLPSIASLTSKLPTQPLTRGPSDLAINPPQRESGSWMTSGTLSGSSTNSMPYLNSAHSPTGPGVSPFTPDNPSAPSAPFHGGFHQHTNGLAAPTSDPTSHPNRGSGDFDDSRRSSVASNGIHAGMTNLVLGPTSPYTSNNASQTSLVSGLQRERGIQTNGYPGGASRYSTMSAGSISSFGSGRGARVASFAAGRVAPPILENPKQEVYSADAPTRGQAYAFPDPDAPREHGRPPSEFSRRNSFAESFTSSILTIESSRLPPELPDAHHHRLQHKQVERLLDDPDSPEGGTPYSRTPELRVTHKLAERKRRSEMKDCFEQLRTRLPTAQNNKSSKWETLSRAIDYISALETQNKQQRAEFENQRLKMAELEAKMMDMGQQMQSIQQPQGSFPPPPNVMPQSPLEYSSHYGNHINGANEPARTLPPIMHNTSMQGVQYDDRR